MAEAPQRTTSDRDPRERGAILIMSALIMMLLLFIAAFATDLGAWYRQGQAQQRAADVSSLNGIQAYDREAKAYLEVMGVTSWAELSTQQRTEGERQAMAEAINTIMGLLEASGESFSTSPTEIQLSPPPNVPGDETVYEVTTDGGTLIRITRSGDTIGVAVTAKGDQYFSNLLRDAPQISRDSTSAISNCNADCSRDIPLEPPFAGFAAKGNGDGFRPLVGDDNRVWLVNHLWDKGFNGGTGSIVCMDVKEQAICSDWAPLDRALYGANRPADVIDNARNKIFYPGISRSDSWTFQIGCVNTDVRSNCSTTSIAGGWGGGPWMVDDNIWAVSSGGNMFCIDPDNVDTANPWCAGYTSSGKASAAAGLVSNGVYVAGDVIGSRILMYHPSHRVWHCWDVSLDAACASAQYGSLWTGYDGSKFIRYNSSGTQIGLCFAVESILANGEYMTHECMSTSGAVSYNPLPNLNMSAPNSWGWSSGGQWGEGYTWNGEKMFMSFWPSHRINCYDWTTSNTCDPIDAVAFDGGDIDFYTFNAFNEDCIISLGDVSKFYTFDPTTGEVCTGSTVTTTITPCACGDGVNSRYGVLEIPEEIYAVLNSASAVINDSSGNELMLIPDLLAGAVDLSSIDGNTHGSVELIITVDSKVDANDIPLWTEPFSASLSLTVQPTLTG